MKFFDAHPYLSVIGGLIALTTIGSWFVKPAISPVPQNPAPVKLTN